MPIPAAFRLNRDDLPNAGEEAVELNLIVLKAETLVDYKTARRARTTCWGFRTRVSAYTAWRVNRPTAHATTSNAE
jgi:hypothetical protein